MINFEFYAKIITLLDSNQYIAKSEADMAKYNEGKVYLEIRDAQLMTEEEKVLLNLSGLAEFAPVEIWSACGTNQQMAYSTHGAFRYFGKFPPPIATHLITQYTKEGDTVFDPMCGSGTTGVEALLLNRKSVLNDISPLSTLLAKVKTTYLDKTLLTEYAEKIYSQYKPLTVDEYDFTPSHLKNYTHWFLPETIDSLRGLKYLIQTIEDKNVREFFLVCFAGTVRRVSKATTQQGRLFLDVETAETDALPFFKKRVEMAIKGVSELPNKPDNTTVISYDLREPSPEKLYNIADLIICHPPYFNSYKYSSINSLELSWLDVDYSQLRKKEVREFFKVGKEEKAEIYANDMIETLENLYPTLKKGACIGLMIGDTQIHGNYIPVTKQILNKIKSIYEIKLVALRAPKYTEAAWVASQRRGGNKVGISLYDFIIILRKNNETN